MTRSRTKRGYPVKPYSDVALQLAAYRWAESAWAHPEWQPRIARKGTRSYYLHPDERTQALMPLEDIVGPALEIETGVLMVTPENAKWFPIDTDRQVLDWVKATVQTYWGGELDLVGQPLYSTEDS